MNATQGWRQRAIVRTAEVLFPRTMLYVQELLLVTLLAAPAAPQESPPPTRSELDFIESTWASCAECHAAPDKRVPADGRWIGLNATTACLTDEAATPRNRELLIDFLRRGDAPAPKLIQASETVAAPDAVGTLRTPPTAGSAFLRRTESEDETSEDGTLRLVWDASEKGSTVQVPPGSYALVGYCFYRVDDEGGRWTASATVNEGAEPDVLEVKAGEALDIGFDATVLHDLSAIDEDGALGITFQLRNVAGDRMTLAREGALVEPTWFLTNPGGTEVASGAFVLT